MLVKNKTFYKAIEVSECKFCAKSLLPPLTPTEAYLKFNCTTYKINLHFMQYHKIADKKSAIACSPFNLLL